MADKRAPSRQQLADAGTTAPKPHYHGHRQRLQERLIKAGTESLPDYEILEVLLAASNPRGDTKPLAKHLVDHFGGIAEVLSADPEALRAVRSGSRGLGNAGIAMLQAVREAALRLIKVELRDRPILGSWDRLIDYCQATMAYGKVEEFPELCRCLT